MMSMRAPGFRYVEPAVATTVASTRESDVFGARSRSNSRLVSSRTSRRSVFNCSIVSKERVQVWTKFARSPERRQGMSRGAQRFAAAPQWSAPAFGVDALDCGVRDGTGDYGAGMGHDSRSELEARSRRREGRTAVESGSQVRAVEGVAGPGTCRRPCRRAGFATGYARRPRPTGSHRRPWSGRPPALPSPVFCRLAGPGPPFETGARRPRCSAEQCRPRTARLRCCASRTAGLPTMTAAHSGRMAMRPT